MRGLIIKDLLVLGKSMRTTLMLIAFFLVMGLVLEDASFLLGMIVILFSVQVVTSFAYDDLARWNPYALSLPVTRNQTVLAKYLLGLLLSLAGGIVSFLVSLISPQNGSASSLPERLLTVYLMLVVSLLFLIIILPLVYRFGTEKSRIMLLAIFALPGIGFTLLARSGVTLPDENTLRPLLYASPAILLGLMVLSYLISCCIFEKKEL